jgi:predicted Rossmann fold nucleotide-binding protein DprA/Smf involved in DNA uptake
MKLGVVGSRKKVSMENVFLILDSFKVKRNIDLIISGGAAGVDSFAGEWAKKNKIELLIFLPQWATFGKSAGAKRNQKIVDASDELLIFWNGESLGTKITMRMAEKANTPYNLIFSGSNFDDISDALEKD